MKKYLFLIFLLSFIIFSPSFNLHLAGDEYQSLWRYKLYFDGDIAGVWNKFNVFFTDYGPQDTFMSFIYKYASLNPIYYYIASFLLRLIASISVIPLVYRITRNRLASCISALFFAITTTGLESTDWVFNMPVYLAIASFNFFLYSYIEVIETKKLSWLVLSVALYGLTFILMPIRMSFLPLFILVCEFYWNYRNFNLQTLKSSTIRILVFFIALFVIFSSTNIGNSVLGYKSNEQNNTQLISKFSAYFSGVSKIFTDKKYTYLINPIGQIGAVVIPSNLVPGHREILSVRQQIKYVIFPSLFVFSIVLTILKKSFGFSKKSYLLQLIFSFIWTYFIWSIFSLKAIYPVQTSQLVSLVWGGYTLIIFFEIFRATFSKKTFSFYFVVALATIVLSFVQYWIRNPESVQVTFSRYLIIPAQGLALLLGLVLASGKNKLVMKFVVLSLIGVHMYTSYLYLFHLSEVRNIKMTENIRRSIPNVFSDNTMDKPKVFYFEPKNSEVLHHALLFGFPVIMSMQYNFNFNHNLIYTENWTEVVAAYQGGDGLKRFNFQYIKPVDPSNIYGYRLEENRLVDITSDIRAKLKADGLRQ